MKATVKQIHRTKHAVNNRDIADIVIGLLMNDA